MPECGSSRRTSELKVGGGPPNGLRRRTVRTIVRFFRRRTAARRRCLGHHGLAHCGLMGRLRRLTGLLLSGLKLDLPRGLTLGRLSPLGRLGLNRLLLPGPDLELGLSDLGLRPLRGLGVNRFPLPGLHGALLLLLPGPRFKLRLPRRLGLGGLSLSALGGLGLQARLLPLLCGELRLSRCLGRARLSGGLLLFGLEFSLVGLHGGLEPLWPVRLLRSREYLRPASLLRRRGA